MKTWRHVGASFVLLCVLACTANRVAFVTIGTTVHAVDAAMNIWADQVVAKKTTPEQEADVRVKFANYQAVAKDLKITLQATNQNPTPAELSGAANAVIDLIEKLTGKQVPR